LLKFIIKKIIGSLITYVLIIFMYNIILNASLEATAESQIAYMCKGYVMGLTNERLQRTVKRLNEGGIEMEETDIPLLKKLFEKELRKVLWLDQPSFLRILRRTYMTLTFDFGVSGSVVTGYGSNMVSDVIFEALPLTLLLFVVSCVFSVFIGIAVGIKKARSPGSLYDKSSSIFTMLFFGTPVWWVGALMILLFSIHWKIFPSGAMYSFPRPQGIMYFIDAAYHLVLPVLTMVLIKFWGISFIVKNLVIVPLQEEYVTAARGRGIPEKKVVRHHALRTAAPAIMTMGILTIVTSIAGDIPIEKVFAWKGLGTILWMALQRNDIPMMLGVLTLITIIYMSALFLLDILYGFLDPRIRISGKEA